MTNSSREPSRGGAGGGSPPEAEEPQSGAAGAITRYVRALAKGREASKSVFEAAWGALRGELRSELRYKSLWSSPPSYVGVYNCESWGASGPASERAGSPLEEFLQDCFTFVLIERIPQLLARLRVHDDIEGDVRLYVRNFVHGRQKDHDPLGFRLFELLRSAVQAAQEAEELFILGGDSSVRNSTILSFSPQTSDSPAADLGVLTTGWASGAVADLFSTGPGSRQRAVERLRSNLVQLESQGIGVFRFKAAIDGLKQDVRAQLAILFELEQGEAIVEVDEEGKKTLIRSLQPETWVEDIDAYRKLVACVTEFVAHYEDRERTRGYLERLWGLLRRFVASDEDRFPAHRQIARLLEIPRARLPTLLEILAGLVRRCSERASGTVVAGYFNDPEPPGGGK